MKSVRAKNQEWIVSMRCIVHKDVYVSGCSEEEARSNPWDFASDEIETDQTDWEVIAVVPNK